MSNYEDMNRASQKEWGSSHTAKMLHIRTLRFAYRNVVLEGTITSA